MSKYKEAIWYIRGCLKTLRFNWKYFPLKQALRLPVLVSPKTRFICLGGEVLLPEEISFGMIRLGGGNYAISDREHVFTLWENRGRVEFKGKARLNHGARFCCHGDLIFGDDVLIGPECDIIAFERVELGESVRISWRCQICDNDFHPIHDLEGNQVNQLTKPIHIGKRVWLGNHVKVGKGVTIDDYNIIAQSSVVVKSIHGNNQVFAGFPAKLIREGVRRIQD